MATLAIAAAAMLVVPGCATNDSHRAALVSAGNDSCEVDVNLICSQVKGRPIQMAATGLMADARMVEQNSIATAPIHTNLRLRSGTILQVECEINYPKQTVVYAHLLPGPNLTKSDIDELRLRELCLNSGQSASP
ncbi:MAG TPA: hypothetical protein VMT58_04245 [Candidatus Binataceae bacterium]|nr:hypothetical protein [Candidatus Binataceae bacterium]